LIIDNTPSNIFMLIKGRIIRVDNREQILVMPKVYKVKGISAVCAAKPTYAAFNRLFLLRNSKYTIPATAKKDIINERSEITVGLIIIKSEAINNRNFL